MPIHHRIDKQHQQAIEPNNQQPIIEQPIIEQLNHQIIDQINHQIIEQNHLSETVQQAATVEIPPELFMDMTSSLVATEEENQLPRAIFNSENHRPPTVCIFSIVYFVHNFCKFIFVQLWHSIFVVTHYVCYELYICCG